MKPGGRWPRRPAFGLIIGLASLIGTCSFALGMAPAEALPAQPTLPPFKLIGLDPDFDKILAPDAQLELITDIPSLRGEGPIWHQDHLWLSDMAGGQILEVASAGTVTTVAEHAGGEQTPGHPTLQGPNGLANWSDAAVLIARQGARDIGLWRQKGGIRPFIRDYQGKRFNSPNDLIVSPDGAVWFTDPPLALAWHPLSRPAKVGTSPTAPDHKPDQQIPFAGVYHFKGKTLTAMVTDMATPNGLAFSPDGKTLYIDNAYPDMYLRAYSVGKNGTLSNGREIFRLSGDTGWGPGVPDGLKVDRDGHIWMTGPGGMLILSSTGKLLGRIQLPRRSTNFTFGDDFQSVFIIASPSIYRLRTKVKGLVPAYTKESVVPR